MYRTAFPANDLLRRRTQTGLVMACLTLSVASTLSLLLFGSRMGVGFTSVSENVLTIGFSLVFAQIIRFLGVLAFIVGAVLTSFAVLLMMTQRTRDLGLIKAAGCPNDLLFGYYITELLLMTAFSCTLGVALGLGTDYALASSSNFAVYQNSANLWFAPLVFVGFFILALIFGSKPILDTVKLSPLTALSTTRYYGLTATGKAKPFTKSNLTVKMALRSLFRRKTVTVRVVLVLSVVFVLLTVSFAGNLIAEQTTTSWISEASGQDIIVIAKENMAAQYMSLLASFAGASVNQSFNYSASRLAVPDHLIQQLRAVPSVLKVDQRLVLREHVLEGSNFTIDPSTGVTSSVGDNREGEFIVVGLDPINLTAKWKTLGRFLQTADEMSVVIGEWLAQRFFEEPLVQNLKMRDKQFAVVGVCVDPIENGRVVYVPIKQLQSTTGVNSSNLVLLELDPRADRFLVTAQIKNVLNAAGSDFNVFDLSQTVRTNVAFLASIWSTILVLPVFTLSSAALSLVAYVMLAINEQRQEFGFLRAMGAKRKTVTSLVAIQSAVIIFSGLGFGSPLGTIITLIVLMRQPVVTALTILEIVAWLSIALASMFFLSLVPAFRLARTSILRIIA